MLKRKFDETADDGGGLESAAPSNGQSESDDSNCSNSSTDAKSPEVLPGPSPPKRIKKKVNFNGVSVFYFPRKQGFTCVPSEGGSTLGMSEKHTFTRDFSLSDFTKEQKRIHRSILAEQRRQGKMFPSPLLASSLPPMNPGEDVSSGSESDSEYDDYYFLQPLPIRQRRVLLRTAGVKKIDNEEKDECRDIRVSRNVCGCDCKTFCDPATCSCSVAGIQCQVDRLSFPCGCTKDGCGNPAGRIEFNPIRVRTHFIHTLMRLELEKTDSPCQAVGPVAKTSFASNRSPEAAGKMNVKSSEVETAEEMTSLSTDAPGDQSCSSTSMGTDTNDGSRVLKSRLKMKSTEVIDLNMFNSNEKGSCRDCQNTEMCNVMMHDVKFSMVSHQQRQQLQQQRAIPTIVGSQYQGSHLQQPQHHLTPSPGMLLLRPPPTSLPPPPPQQQQHSEHMLLFNDGEEEIYRTENTSSMYFDNDDASYPDMSDMPSVLESRPFSSISQSSFSRKFHGLPSHMFSSGIGGSSGSVCNQSSIMPKQARLPNPGGIQNLQMNGDCGTGLSSASYSDLDLDQRRSCGLLMHSHTQQSNAQSHLTPFLPEEPQLSSGQCRGSPGNRILSHSHQSQNGCLTHTHLGNSLEHSVTGISSMLEGRVPDFQSKIAGNDLLETTVLAATASYKIASTHTGTHYSSSTSSVAEKNYMNQPNHMNFVGPTTVNFDNLTASSSSNDGSTRFPSLRSAQQSCWSASFANPTLRECLGLGTSSSVSSSIADQSSAQQGISQNAVYQQEPCATASSPPSPDSSTITYTTMTATTRDRLAAHCPGISSHMDSRSELPACTLKDSNPSFTNYYISSDSPNTNRVLGGCQNLMYDLPYPDTSTVDSCTDFNVAFAAAEQNRTSSDTCMNISSTSATLSLSQPLVTSPQTSSCSPPEFTSRLYSTEVSSTSTLPISSTLIPSLSSTLILSSSSTLIPSSSSSNSPASCQTMAHQSFTQQPTSTTDADTFLHNPHVYSSNSASCNSLGVVVSTVGVTTPAEEAAKEPSNDSGAVHHKQSTLQHPDLPDMIVSSLKASCNSTEQINVVNSCDEEGQAHINDVHCDSLSCDIPDAEYEENRNYEACATDSEVISSLSSSAAQSAASSSTSSSSSSPTSEEEKEHHLNQDFGEIIKESIVEMVLV
ncbi:unnamed protein product [Candidula unifasciata]|uniref:Cysteine/serine-rich nuclear protein N-terminal domain-containing protein n=1 Tax=Candidula unifasciata TaxID=100452 RepID=A0A8S3ZNK1_9EUPU|nr:unnamed protein product [Candidula unifasciata]